MSATTRSPPASCRYSTAPFSSSRRRWVLPRPRASTLTLVRETSWANIRDRLAVGHFQVAHMLAPMPIACNLGLTPARAPTIAPMALGLGGNAITVSNALWDADGRARRRESDLDPATTGAALKEVVRTAPRGEPAVALRRRPPALGPQLRAALLARGLRHRSDARRRDRHRAAAADGRCIGAGTIDGYCVGEPWNTAAVLLGQGHIATVKAAIWRSSPEKVLGAGAAWADRHPEALAALVRALYRAGAWCADPANRAELAALLAEPAHVGRPADWMLPACRATSTRAGGRSVMRRLLRAARQGGDLSWKSHALWLYTQMVRWGQMAHTPRRRASPAKPIGPTFTARR